MEILFGFILSIFLIFAFAAGISKATTWIFEIGLWACIFLLSFFLITIGVFLTIPFLVTCLLSVGLATVILESIGGKKDLSKFGEIINEYGSATDKAIYMQILATRLQVEELTAEVIKLETSLILRGDIKDDEEEPDPIRS